MIDDVRPDTPGLSASMPPRGCHGARITYVRIFTSMTDAVEGIEEGEVEYEMTRKQGTHFRDIARETK